MKNFYKKPFIPIIVVFCVAAGLFSCLNPLEFDASKITGLSGKIEDVTSAVLVLANKSKTTDVTNVAIGGGG